MVVMLPYIPNLILIYVAENAKVSVNEFCDSNIRNNKYIVFLKEIFET